MHPVRFVLAALAVCALAAPACAAPKVVALPEMSPAKWKGDVDAFARELPKRHLNAFHSLSREEFDRAAAELKARAETANDDEMIVGLLQITAKIGDAHTGVRLPAGGRRLPVQFGLFGDDVRVIAAAESAKVLLGGKLLRLDDVDAKEAVARVRTVISQHESEPYVRGLLPVYLTIAEVLHGLGVMGDRSRVNITVQNATGETVRLAAATVGADVNRAQWPSASAAIPLSRQSPDDGFVVRHLDPQKAVYVNFRSYEDLGKRARSLWDMVDNSGASKLIVDLRQNGGGDYTEGRKHLVRGVSARSSLKTYVLVGNRTFSAAMNNAVDLRNAGAVLVGQPIGERPNSYQENDQFSLPASRLVVSYSTRFYKFVPDGSPPIVTPDVLFEPEWGDFLAGRDAALEWILSQP